MTCEDCKKLEMKLKMMEISFELINNSRNDLLSQLANAEIIIDRSLEYVESIDTLYQPKILRILKGGKVEMRKYVK